MRHLVTVSVAMLLWASASDAGPAAEVSSSGPSKSATPAADPYVPGLGDFMTAYIQPHHIKLWLAGSVANWPLAAYEANELAESFEDITTYQSTWKDVPVKRLVGSIVMPPLRELDAAIAAKSLPRFKTAFRSLTAACNGCHQAAKHAFLEITVPKDNPFPDQLFGAH